MVIAAKGKQSRSEREHDADLEKNLKTPKKAVQKPVETRVRASDVRGVVEETLARVYGDLFPTLTTHDEDENVDLEIKEEAYIITLVMYVGSDSYTPRQGIPLKEKEISDDARYCKEHR